MASAHWVCYAWPADRNGTGRRVFVTSAAGDILAAPNTTQQYSGLAKRPDGAAAFTVPNDITSALYRSGGPPSNDGEAWTAVN
jgi:hypothetical protein